MPSIEDLAKGKTSRRWCNDCGTEFRQKTIKNIVYYGCEACWRARGCVGPLPTNAAPHGLNAAFAEAPSGADAPRPLRRKSLPGAMLLHQPPSPSMGLQSLSGTAESWRQGPKQRRLSEGHIGLEHLSLGLQKELASSATKRERSRDGTLPKLSDGQGLGSAHGACTPGMTAGRQMLSRQSSRSALPPPEVAPASSITTTLMSLLQASSTESLLPRLPTALGPGGLAPERTNQILSKLKPNMEKALDEVVRCMEAQNLAERELFDALDADGGGTLSRAELMHGLRKFGVKLLPVELDGVLRSFDTDGNGTIDFEEFHEFIKERGLSMPRVEPVMDPNMLGFEVGQRVRVLVRLSSQEGLDGNDFGTVRGPGVPGVSLLVHLDNLPHQELFLKPMQLRAFKTSKRTSRDGSYNILSGVRHAVCNTADWL